MSRKSIFRRWWWKLKKLAGNEAFLCDTCRFDYRNACQDPQRPNATECDRYERR